jgi:hypothetical protein
MTARRISQIPNPAPSVQTSEAIARSYSKANVLLEKKDRRDAYVPAGIKEGALEHEMRRNLHLPRPAEHLGVVSKRAWVLRAGVQVPRIEVSRV